MLYCTLTLIAIQEYTKTEAEQTVKFNLDTTQLFYRALGLRIGLVIVLVYRSRSIVEYTTSRIGSTLLLYCHV